MEESLLGSLTEFIDEDFSLMFDSRKKRLDELLLHMIESQKDSEGNVNLSEGFEKSCGLKGSKLSGG